MNIVTTSSSIFTAESEASIHGRKPVTLPPEIPILKWVNSIHKAGRAWKPCSSNENGVFKNVGTLTQWHLGFLFPFRAWRKLRPPRGANTWLSWQLMSPGLLWLFILRASFSELKVTCSLLWLAEVKILGFCTWPRCLVCHVENYRLTE